MAAVMMTKSPILVRHRVVRRPAHTRGGSVAPT